jgi:hypothetical protein
MKTYRITVCLTLLGLATACNDSTSPSTDDKQVTMPQVPAFALGVAATIPAYSSGSGTGKLTSLSHVYTGTKVSGSVRLKSIGGNCVYVQKKGVARFHVDGIWTRATANLCSASTGTPYTWSASWTGNYDGIGYRICRSQPYVTDPCGNSVTIYP